LHRGYLVTDRLTHRTLKMDVMAGVIPRGLADRGPGIPPIRLHGWPTFAKEQQPLGGSNKFKESKVDGTCDSRPDSWNGCGVRGSSTVA
jgi:hypothetical protein